ncbi:uncharacterized protein MYCFIDRAFT_84774 [Pseudocercospora fijiensis CIRAD86]|uniref:Uncharacterized protein n=1 Tax=Pseudocercospora fijiensis (strain CIRAD86) TaxID=383855 RepID=M3AH22_PSEFD|nr:uncharacterized protein MYCFIDRAFT_84774 [Pseudocercospora fijiensis CIRAD86]EME76787.1 hypothetical protein MYCFIDRAFT_84774 [Pseudocercospora fijiensis CIRAD86]
MSPPFRDQVEGQNSRKLSLGILGLQRRQHSCRSAVARFRRSETTSNPHSATLTRMQKPTDIFDSQRELPEIIPDMETCLRAIMHARQIAFRLLSRGRNACRLFKRSRSPAWSDFVYGNLGSCSADRSYLDQYHPHDPILMWIQEP